MIRSPFQTLFTLTLVFVIAAAGADPVPAVQASPDTIPLGSTRYSVAAIPATELPDELVYLTSGRPDAFVAELNRLAPNIEIVSGLDREGALQHADRAHAVDAHLLTPAFLQASPRLRWAISWSAGVDRYIAIPELMAREEVVLTNMQGMYGPVMAEHVFGMLLQHTRNLGHYMDADARGTWDRGPRDALGALQGRTMLILGLGGIGTEVATRAAAFNLRVLGTVRTPRPPPDYVEILGTTANHPELLPQADIVVLAVPLTDETRSMIDREAIALMKDGAWLVNVARGPVVDTEALVEALDSGKIGAAFLDVTDPEPLPDGHTLWGRDNVLITPHVAARAELSGERAEALALENLRRFGAGLPLLNVVNKEAGY